MIPYQTCLRSARTRYLSACQKTGTFLGSYQKEGTQSALFLMGMLLLVFGVGGEAIADRSIHYNATRVTEAVNAVLLYLEGSFGALVMVCAGIGSILSSAFGQYRASLGLMVVAIGSFILRSILSTFINDQGIMQ